MNTIKAAVQQKYGEAAMQVRTGAKAGCGCGASCEADPITSGKTCIRLRKCDGG